MRIAIQLLLSMTLFVFPFSCEQSGAEASVKKAAASDSEKKFKIDNLKFEYDKEFVVVNSIEELDQSGFDEKFKSEFLRELVRKSVVSWLEIYLSLIHI